MTPQSEVLAWGAEVSEWFSHRTGGLSGTCVTVTGSTCAPQGPESLLRWKETGWRRARGLKSSCDRTVGLSYLAGPFSWGWRVDTGFWQPTTPVSPSLTKPHGATLAGVHHMLTSKNSNACHMLDGWKHIWVLMWLF